MDKNGFEMVITGVDAGGGATLSLLFNRDTREVKEEKTLADGKVLTITISLKDFEDNYEEMGHFLDYVDGFLSVVDPVQE